MDDLQELYQQLILDHHKRPRNYGSIADTPHHAEGMNPLCGDHIKVYLILRDERVEKVAFEGEGCAICTASASLMTETVMGKTRTEVEELFEQFHGVVTGKLEDVDVEEMGKLAAFVGVSAYPVRVKCATLAWHTLNAAIHKPGETVSTE